jgi:hypothetical protein
MFIQTPSLAIVFPNFQQFFRFLFLSFANFFFAMQAHAWSKKHSAASLQAMGRARGVRGWFAKKPSERSGAKKAAAASLLRSEKRDGREVVILHHLENDSLVRVEVRGCERIIRASAASAPRRVAVGSAAAARRGHHRTAGAGTQHGQHVAPLRTENTAEQVQRKREARQ